MRYFPVSQDINADPEVWELTDRFGVTGLRAWLEILSIADRNKGELPGPWNDYPRLLAGRCQSTTRHLLGVCQFITRWLLVDSQNTARLRNYAKYHKTRAGNRPAPNLTKPNLTIEDKNKSANAPLVLPEWLLKSEWESFKEFRTKIRKPLTAKAEELAISKLAALKAQGCEPCAVLEQSIINGWSGLFPTRPIAVQNVHAVQAEGELSERTQRILRRGL